MLISIDTDGFGLLKIGFKSRGHVFLSFDQNINPPPEWGNEGFVVTLADFWLSPSIASRSPSYSIPQ